MTPIAHSSAGFLGWEIFSENKNPRTLIIFILMANIPDIDFFFYFLLGKDIVGPHQYYTHNIFFVVLAAVIFWPLINSGKERAGVLLVAFSHLILDLFTIDTADPIGFRLFYPLSRQLFNLGLFPNILKSNWAEIFSFNNIKTFCLEIVIFVFPVYLLHKKKFKISLKKE